MFYISTAKPKRDVYFISKTNFSDIVILRNSHSFKKEMSCWVRFQVSFFRALTRTKFDSSQSF